jgi:type III restriction enzyme
MSNPFFDHPILNPPYDCPAKHWELNEDGQPTEKVLETRRRAQFITPIPKPKKRKSAAQQTFVFDDGKGLSTEAQQYDPTSIINEVRGHVNSWRSLPNPNQWQVTPETARLLQHWRHHTFSGIRPFFCQVEAVETAIWLTEVAPQSKHGKRVLDHLAAANRDANPELMRLALKLATGAGKTTVMAMLIAWQTINAVRRPGSRNFTRGFLICAPGLTIKDRLRVLQPNDPDSYYKDRELLPGDLLDDMSRAKIVITNYHAFKMRERIEISKGGRQLLQGRTGDELRTLESEGQMLQRVMPDLMGMKNILVINDEAHHCYREKPKDADDEDLKGDDRKEAEKNNEAARLWISGLEAVNRKLGTIRVIDLSATPFFLRGSGYAEGTLFPWTMSDFSLMDAIECGIVKLPRVPVAENIPGNEMPVFRNLWENISKDMPKKGRGPGRRPRPPQTPHTIADGIAGALWPLREDLQAVGGEGIRVPPCFIIVCQNTAISKLVYDFVSGFQRKNDDGTTTLENGRLPLFRNFDETTGNPLPRPNTLLIDSEQLEAGDALDDNFRSMAADEIERFRREIVERSGDARSGDNITDQELLREVMNTVGKPEQLGRRHPLRRLGVDAHRRLGRQHRHPCARHPRLRHPVALRAGHRPGAAPPVLRVERGRAVQRRVRRRLRHPLRLHRQAGHRATAAATRDGAGQGRSPRARRARNPLSPGRGLSRRVARGTADRRLQRRLDPGTQP